MIWVSSYLLLKGLARAEADASLRELRQMPACTSSSARDTLQQARASQKKSRINEHKYIYPIQLVHLTLCVVVSNNVLNSVILVKNEDTGSVSGLYHQQMA